MIDRLDHLVLTVASVDATCDFYSCCLGFERVDSPGLPTALHVGRQKINVHQTDRTFEPKALAPTPGSGDICLIASVPLEQVMARFAEQGVAIEVGPVDRTGALGPMRSVYVRDPDGNLVEVSRYPDSVG